MSTSRRTVLAALAVPAAAVRPAVALAAPAAEPHPDAALLALVAEHTAAIRELDAAEEFASDRWERVEPRIPPIPDALLRDGDDRHFGSWAHDNRVALYYDLRGVERFRASKRLTWGLLCDRDIRAARVRAQEIVAAWDAWQAERKGIHDEVGYTAAQEAVGRASDRCLAIEAAVMRTRPTTLAGFHAKARVWGGFQIDELEEVRLGDPMGAEFSRAMRADLLALGGTV